MKSPRWPQPAPATHHHLRSGQWGEDAAEHSLRQKGYRILGRRVRPGPRLELDLIARDGDCLVFVEVKTRKSDRFGHPASAIDRSKRRLLSRAAVQYMLPLRPRPHTFRFDVVEVIGDPDLGTHNIHHIVNAFPIEGGYRAPW